MAEDQFQNNVESLFKGMDGFLTTKSVVGEPMQVGDTIIIPLADVSFGVAAGSFVENNKKNNGGGGLGGKIEPTAMLIIQNGSTKLVNVKNTDGVSRIMDMVPDFINRFTGSKKEEDDFLDPEMEVEDEE